MVELKQSSLGLLSNFASPYVIYKDSEKLDKPNQILWTVLSFFVPCVPILMFRQKVREQNGIEVSTLLHTKRVKYREIMKMIFFREMTLKMLQYLFCAQVAD